MSETPSMMNGSTLILLVGSNPMPNYLAACALRPAQVVLVYSEKTLAAMKRLTTGLQAALGDRVTIGGQLLEDETSAAALKDAIALIARQKPKGSLAINYTGGTKVMAAHALRAFYEQGGSAAAASYLHEGTVGHPTRLRFDDGRVVPLMPSPHVPLTLRILLELHGATYHPPSAKDGAPSSDDAREVLRAVLADVTLAARLYEASSTLKEAKSPKKVVEPFDLTNEIPALSVPRIPVDAAMPKASFDAWLSFIGGGWLEDCVGDVIRSLKLPDATVEVGVNATREKASLEVDVAIVRGHRSYFISCTTDTKKYICKSKLFEIAVRSQHLGGELARAALVCLAEPKTIAGLASDIDDLWLSSNPTRVFGIDDVSEWFGFGGAPANTQKLANWLVS